MTAAGFRGKPKVHYEYIEEGRRPWLYRPAGSMMIPNEQTLHYPRICAHRGFSTVALGADEIEFDLWATKDGELVSVHDFSLERVSNGTGNVWDYTLEELKQFDFGCKTAEQYAGLEIITFEDILKKFACTAIFNIHMKIWDMNSSEPQYERIAALLRQYGCEHHCYMMSTSDKCLAEFHEVAPDIERCVGWDGEEHDMRRMIDRAIKLGVKKIQLFKPFFNQDSIDYAHLNGIRCNVFWADEPQETCRYIDMGIDTILTNDYLRVSNAVKTHIKRKSDLK